MKKSLLVCLATLISFSSLGANNVQPNQGSDDYVKNDRFKATYMKDPLDYIITDTKTGCQYFIMMGGGGTTSQFLGCFDEYKKDKSDSNGRKDNHE